MAPAKIEVRATPRSPRADDVPAPRGRAKAARGEGPAKLFVLDTNVLMHDPMALFRFDEHDVFLPMMTLEELDNNKKGLSEVARNARQVSRELDALATFADANGAIDTQAGIALAKTGHKDAGGKLIGVSYIGHKKQSPAKLPVKKVLP